MIDDHSRLLIAPRRPRTVFKAADIVTDLHHPAMTRHGRPVADAHRQRGRLHRRTASGPLRHGGRARLPRDQLCPFHPYHPQTCGKVSACTRPLKRFLAKQPRARSIVELQAQLDRFVAYYNDGPAPSGVGRRTPIEAFCARPKATPRGPRLEIPPHFRVRRDKIDITGVITLRHNSRLHHIGLGRRLVGTRVLALVDGFRSAS